MGLRDEKWVGGYIHRTASGRASYVIRRRIDGTLYERATGASSLRAAIAQLENFERDPPGYRAGGGGPQPIFLTVELVAEYLESCGKNSERYLAAKRANLSWWSKQLRGVDLRRATLRGHILPALKGSPQRNQRIAVIKHIYSWMRTEDLITVAEDPCMKKLRADPPKPAQHEISKVIPKEHYEKARRHMMGVYRDGLDLLAGTGWHITEAVRFAEAGDIEPYTGLDPGGHSVLTVRHKSGAMHRTVVTEATADSAARLRAAGKLSESMLAKTIRAACDAAEIPRFKPGWFRHTIATLAWETGDAERVPAFLGHRSRDTSKKYYATRAVPPRIPTLR